MKRYIDSCKIKFTNIQGEDISDEEYFFHRQGLSNSRIGLINPYQDFGKDYGAGSPQLYLNKPKFKSGSLALGSAVHCQILQPNDFEISDYEGKPGGKLGDFIDQLYKFRQEGLSISESITKASAQADYYNGKFGAGIFKKAVTEGLDYYLKLVHKAFEGGDKEIIVLPKKMLYTARKCIEAFNKNNAIQYILKENIFEPKTTLNEIAMFTDLEVTLPGGKQLVLPFKGKFDSVVIDPEAKILYLNDIKTTSKSLEYFMGQMINGEWYNGSMESHCYYRQFAVYFIMLQMYCEQVLHMDLSDWTLKCNVFCIETTGEMRAECIPISQGYMEAGKDEFKELICRIAYHETYGYDKEFPEYI